jgi:hypothetical protein
MTTHRLKTYPVYWDACRRCSAIWHSPAAAGATPAAPNAVAGGPAHPGRFWLGPLDTQARQDLLEIVEER